MNAALRTRALAALAHPLSLLAAAGLLFNSQLAQARWPGFWTGKLSDLAWMVLAPLLAAAGLAALAGRRWPLTAHRLEALALGGVGVVFVLVKTAAPVNTAVHTWANALGLTLKLALDPTDLLVLPGLWLAQWIWRRPITPRAHRWRGPAAALAALALLADSPAPQPPRFDCLPSTHIVIAHQTNTGYFTGSTATATAYRTQDGGLTWEANPAYAADDADCTAPAFPLPVGEASLYHVPGMGLYLSEDGGRTLHLERALPEVYGARVDAATRHLIVAAGATVEVRLPDGEWRTVLP